MSRAALLPSLADPVLLFSWIKLYKNVWKNEVDKLYVLLHGNQEPELINFSKKLFEDVGAVVFVEEQSLQHGDGIAYLLNRCTEEYVVLLEDDSFVLQQGALDTQFKKLENNEVDVIGSTRSSCSPELITACGKVASLTGNSPEHSVAQCPNLWPCFLFAKRETLLNTDQNFNAKDFKRGEFIQLLNHTCSDNLAGDTFVWATIQLRVQKKRFGYVHQHHASITDLSAGLLKINPPWVHFGSLSSLNSGGAPLLRDENHIPLGRLGKSNANYPSWAGATKKEVARRVAIANLFIDYFPTALLPEYASKYKSSVQLSISRFNFDHSVVESFKNVYRKILRGMF